MITQFDHMTESHLIPQRVYILELLTYYFALISTRWSASRIILTTSRAILSLHAATARGFMMSIGSPEIRKNEGSVAIKA